MGKKEKEFKNKYKVQSEEEILSEIYGDRYVKEMQEKIDKKIERRNKKEGKTIEPKKGKANYFHVVMRGDNAIGITEEQYLNEDCKGYKKKIMISRYPGPDGKPSLIQIGHLDHRTEEEKQADKNKEIEY